MSDEKQEGALVEARRKVIADSELTDIEEEFQRWKRRLSNKEDGEPEKCANFLANYAPVLVKAIRATENLAGNQAL